MVVLQWAQQLGVPWRVSTSSVAAPGCYLPVLQWTMGQQAHQFLCRPSSEWLLKWACQQDTSCIWHAKTTASAPSQGYLTGHQWARRHGCPCTDTGHAEAEQLIISMTISCLVSKGRSTACHATRAAHNCLCECLCNSNQNGKHEISHNNQRALGVMLSKSAMPVFSICQAYARSHVCSWLSPMNWRSGLLTPLQAWFATSAPLRSLSCAAC